MREGTAGEQSLGENMFMARTPRKGTEPLSPICDWTEWAEGWAAQHPKWRSRDVLVPSTADLLTQPFLGSGQFCVRPQLPCNISFLLTLVARAGFMGTQRPTNATGYLV